MPGLPSRPSPSGERTMPVATPAPGYSRPGSSSSATPSMPSRSGERPLPSRPTSSGFGLPSRADMQLPPIGEEATSETGAMVRTPTPVEMARPSAKIPGRNTLASRPSKLPRTPQPVVEEMDEAPLEMAEEYPTREPSSGGGNTGMIVLIGAAVLIMVGVYFLAVNLMGR